MTAERMLITRKLIPTNSSQSMLQIEELRIALRKTEAVQIATPRSFFSGGSVVVIVDSVAGK
ncbi:MAG: hypothetical protein CM15mP49_10100 [Actinomycetota bacterium]|nr:MAG: hypothetical protein CM15mP49_10100 [Actinomycetota bacterium]